MRIPLKNMTGMSIIIRNTNKSIMKDTRDTSMLTSQTFSKHLHSLNTYDVIPCEKDVIMAFLDNNTNEDIAKAMGLKEATVKFHLWKIYQKLGVKNRRGLINKLNEIAEGEA